MIAKKLTDILSLMKKDSDRVLNNFNAWKFFHDTKILYLKRCAESLLQGRELELIIAGNKKVVNI